jgi:hypothetical protein
MRGRGRVSRKGAEVKENLISEAQGYGLDVEPERCDLSLLHEDLKVLRYLTPATRERIVGRMNEGHALTEGVPWDD